MKIAYNACYGGFGLSDVAKRRWQELTGSDYDDCEVMRHDASLVQVIEELGAAASGAYAEIRLLDLPVGSQYCIDDYDGHESVVTPESITWIVLE